MKLPWKSGDTGYIPSTGIKEVTIMGIKEEETKYGPSLLVQFNDGEGLFGLWFSPRLSPKSNLGKLVMAAGIQPQVGQEFDLDSLVGKKIKLLITKTPNGFPKGQALNEGETPF